MKKAMRILKGVAVVLGIVLASLIFAAASTGCDDTFVDLGACMTSEVCNGVDDDCDGNTDEGMLVMFYPDRDGDGYGDSNFFVSYSCPDLASSSWVANRGDCDDLNAEIHPGAGCPPCEVTYYRDADSDTYGDPTSSQVFSCDDESVVGYITTIGDCNDFDSTVRTGAAETCNGTDDDCDTVVDEDCS